MCRRQPDLRRAEVAVLGEGFLATGHWLRAAFAELRFECFETLAEDEPVAVLASVTGRHMGASKAYSRRTNAFSSARFIFSDCVLVKLWSIWRSATILVYCFSSAGAHITRDELNCVALR
jgi:hypothetical protein